MWHYPEWPPPTNGFPYAPPTRDTYKGHVGEYNGAWAEESGVYLTWTDYRLSSIGTIYGRKQSDIRFIRLSWPVTESVPNASTFMKPYRILIYAALSVSFNWTTLGQGLSTFFLFNGDGINAPVFNAEGVPLGPEYLVELWGAAAPDSLVPAVDLGNSRNRLIVPFAGGGYFQASAGFLAVPSMFNGGYSWLQVRAWDAELGGTYEEAAARGIGGYGESPLFYADGGDPTKILPEVPGPLIGLESFSLRPLVPEPSTWILFLLGGIGLWCATRRRSRTGGSQPCE
jgi:hypothetical protein